MLDLNHDPPVLYLLSSWAYRCETWALNIYAIQDFHEVPKGIFSEGVVVRKKNTNRKEYSKTQCNPLDICGSRYGDCS
jgi:hypothetical protein